MADLTPRLGFGLADPAASDKTVSINAFMEDAEALFGGFVKSRTTAVPPVAPAQGDSYIVPAAATGAWANQTNVLARYRGTGWRFYAPQPGLTFYIADQSYSRVYFNGATGAWTVAGAGGGTGITAVIQDTAPVFGGDVGGGNHRIGNIRGQSVEFDSATALTSLGIIPGYSYKYVGAALDTAVVLPLNVAEDTIVVFLVRTSGSLLFSVEDSAKMELLSGAGGQFRLLGRGAECKVWCTARDDNPDGTPSFVEWTVNGLLSP